MRAYLVSIIPPTRMFSWNNLDEQLPNVINMLSPNDLNEQFSNDLNEQSWMFQNKLFRMSFE
jgi:hypothetical protein